MQLIFSENHSPAVNFSTEKELFYSSADDFLLLYVNEKSVVAGANQAVENEVNLDFCKKNDITVIKRISGGGAVFHDLGNLNYCFIKTSQSDKYILNNDFLTPIVDVLHQMKIPAQIGKRNDLWLPDGFKIGGTASYIRKNRILQHGTLLYNTDLTMLHNSLTVNEKDATLKGISSVPSPVKNIKTYLHENDLPVFENQEFFDNFAEKLKSNNL